MKEWRLQYSCVKNNLNMAECAEEVKINIYLCWWYLILQLGGNHPVRAELQQLNGWQVLTFLRPLILLLSFLPIRSKVPFQLPSCEPQQVCAIIFCLILIELKKGIYVIHK